MTMLRTPKISIALAWLSIAMLSHTANADVTPGNTRPTPFVETADAYFFESPSNDIIFYFPKMITTLVRSQPEVPGVERWRAAVVLAALSNRDPGAVNAAWAGKIARPYNITLNSECTLTRDAEMRSVQQSIKALHRDLSGAESTPVCEFIFRLPSNGSNTKIEALKAQAEAGTLITKSFSMAIHVERYFAWAPLLTALRTLVAKNPGIPLSQEEARVLIGGAAALDPILAATLAAAPESSNQAFVDTALATLFVKSKDTMVVTSAVVNGNFLLAFEERHAL
jgi:hypothetical protein